MKKDFFKKAYAMILAICVIMTTIAMPAFATETEPADSNLHGFKLATMESGKQFEFMLLDVQEKNGNYLVVSKELLGGWGVKPTYIADPQNANNKILGQHTTEGGITFDAAYLNNYPTDLQSYMADTQWDITFGNGDAAYSMVSKLCLPTEVELNANAEAFAHFKLALTNAGGPGKFYVRGAWCHDLVTLCDGVSFGAVDPTGDTAGYFPFAFNLNKDFFKNIKLDVTTMGTSVKDILTNNFTRLEMMNVYSDEELNAIGFDEIEFIESLNSFTVSAENVEDGRQADYILLNPEENNGNFLIMSKGIVGGWGVAPKYMSDPEDANNTILGLDIDGGKTFDAAYLDSFPATVQNNMVNTTWEIDFGVGDSYYMTSKLCLPTDLELTANTEAFEYMKTAVANAGGPGTFIVRGAWDNSLVTRYSGGSFGAISPTGCATHYPLVFNVNKDFFKNVKLDVTTMGTNIKNILTGNYGKTQMKGIYTDAELEIIGYGENPTVITGASFRLANKEDGKTNEFIVLDAADDNSNFLIMSKGIVGGWGVAPKYMSDPEDANNTILGLDIDGGKTFDAAYLDSFPATVQNNMVNTTWEIDFGVGDSYYMTSKLCLPTDLELTANTEAFEYMKTAVANAGGPGTFIVRGAWDNSLVTRYSGGSFGAISPTGCATHYPLVFNVNKDFFKNVKLDVTTMGSDVRDILINNVSRFDLEKIYTVAELETVYYEKNDIVPYDKELQISYNTENASTATAVNAIVKVANNTLSNAEDVSVIFAIYANDGRLINVDVNEVVDINAFSTADVPLSITGDAGFSNNCTFKAFVWSNMSDLTPLTE